MIMINDSNDNNDIIDKRIILKSKFKIFDKKYRSLENKLIFSLCYPRGTENYFINNNNDNNNYNNNDNNNINN